MLYLWFIHIVLVQTNGIYCRMYFVSQMTLDHKNDGSYA